MVATLGDLMMVGVLAAGLSHQAARHRKGSSPTAPKYPS